MAEEKKADDAQPKARLVSSDAPTPDGDKAAEEHPYWVNNKPVTREEYMEALPKAGYVPENMPANHYPSIRTN